MLHPIHVYFLLAETILLWSSAMFSAFWDAQFFSTLKRQKKYKSKSSESVANQKKTNFNKVNERIAFKLNAAA